uniref:Transmembrane protein 255B n=1 Tax=Fundulus heteroclitus TaxID=8078 RepID=A0A3Q2QI11_FUNHE
MDQNWELVPQESSLIADGYQRPSLRQRPLLVKDRRANLRRRCLRCTFKTKCHHSFSLFLFPAGLFKLVAAIIFISIGVIASFFCAIVDGIIASEFIVSIDIRPLQEDMCDYYSSGSAYVFDNYYNEVTCRSFNKACKIKLRSNTCYCCYLYNCDNTEYYPHYYEFTGVSSCWDVIHLHRLLWASVVLNVIALFLGIIDAAILGAYKDMVRRRPRRFTTTNDSYLTGK